MKAPPNSICYLLNWRIMIKWCVFSGKIGYKLEEETIWECKNKSKYSHTHKNESKSVAKQLAVACIGSLPLDFHESGEISHPRVKPSICPVLIFMLFKVKFERWKTNNQENKKSREKHGVCVEPIKKWLKFLKQLPLLAPNRMKMTKN